MVQVMAFAERVAFWRVICNRLQKLVLRSPTGKLGLPVGAGDGANSSMGRFEMNTDKNPNVSNVLAPLSSEMRLA